MDEVIRWPITEADLEKHYSLVMPEADRRSLERRESVWARWPDICASAGTWECLQELHVMLFGGIFSFAGKVRSSNITKGGFRFANPMFLENNLPIIAKMPQGSFDEILEKYVEMNIAHPFREGNGRAARLWLDAMLEKELRTRVDWGRITRDDYMSAMQRSLVNSTELSVLLRGALLAPELLGDKLLFLAGLLASYGYERD